MNPRTVRIPSSNASHGLRSRHWPRARRANAASLDPERPDPARVAVQAARRQQRMEEAEPERGLDRCGAEVAFDPVEDGRRAPRAGGAYGDPAGRRRGPRRPRRPGSGRRGGPGRGDRRPVRRGLGPDRRRRARPSVARRRASPRQTGRRRACGRGPAVVLRARLPAGRRAPGARRSTARGLGAGATGATVSSGRRHRPAIGQMTSSSVDDPAAGRAARREQLARPRPSGSSGRGARRPSPGTPRRGGAGPAGAGRARRAGGSGASIRG